MEKRKAVFLNLLGSVISGQQVTQEIIDCETFQWLYEQAQEQNLVPFLYEALGQTQWLHKLPDDIVRQMEQQTLCTITSQITKTEELFRIYEKLTTKGIMVVILKGLICRKTYGEYADHRASGDEDLWIRKEEYSLCEQVLLENGYQRENKGISGDVVDQVQEITFYHSSSDLTLEVHINPMGNYGSMEQRMNKVLHGSLAEPWKVKIDGIEVMTLTPTNHMVFLLLHFIKHFVSSGIGIRQMMDLFMFGTQYEKEIHWDKVLEVIKEFKMEGLMGDVIFIGDQYFSIRLPISLPVIHPEKLIDDMLESGIFGIGTKEHAAAAQMTLSRMEGSNKSTLRKTLFPTVERMKQGYPVLYRHPYLLPYAWIKRFFKFANNYRKQRTLGENLAAQSMEISKRRIALLEAYKIIP